MSRDRRSPTGRAFWCPPIPAFARIADLKGKRVGFTKGSSAHNVVIATLEKAGLTYADITPVYLTPPDAGPAFANGSIDAWAIWDPYFAIGEKQAERPDPRQRPRSRQDQFVLSSPTAISRTPMCGKPARSSTAWRRPRAGPRRNRDEVASALAAVTGVPLEIQTVAANRASFVIGPVTDEIVATQQAVADRFHKLGLIPKPIAVRDIVWRHTPDLTIPCKRT